MATDRQLLAEIQSSLRARVQKPDAALLEQAGVIAEINVEEAGLNSAEGSFGGITPQAWSEFCSINSDIETELPAAFERLPAETVADYIFRFNMWYFTKPPKVNFFALPPLLWLVACDAAYLADTPIITRIQKLIDSPKPDGIWGSGMTERVQAFFENKTVPDIVLFAQDLTDLIVARYQEMAEYDAYAEVAPHWIARCKRKMQTLLEFVNKENELASTQAEEAPAEMPSEEQPALADPYKRDQQMIVECLDGQSKVIEAQSKVITELKDALLTHTSMQEDILLKLSELPTQPPEKPQSPRDLLNALPDPLVQ